MRRDRLGRRIGHNAWREYVLDAYRPARQAWWERMEAATAEYATELAEWTADNPGPTLKGFLVGLKGTWP